MNKELHKTICEQLPYGTLKCFQEGEAKIIIGLKDHIGIMVGRKSKHGETWVPLNYSLPVLRHMDLTKPITHKGETFVPIERMYELFLENPNFIIDFDNIEFALKNNQDLIIAIPQYLTDELSRLHFNWRGIPDELVKYTDEFDYEIY